MNVLMRCSGGLGKTIAFTAVVKQWHEEHADDTIHVMSAYPDVFANLDFVESYYTAPVPGMPMNDFYKLHKDFDIVEAEPYTDLQYRQGKEHLIDVWCRKLNLKYPSERKGILILSDSEKQWADNLWTQYQLASKKIIAAQFFGGTSYHNPTMAADPTRDKQVRDIPKETAQKVVDELNKLGFIVMQVSLNTEPQLNNVMRLPIANDQVMSPRFLFALLNKCDGLVGIDSFSHHAWVALGKSKAVTCFGSTNPTNLGYSINTSLSMKNSCKTIHCNRPDSYMYDVTGAGKSWQCPTGNCMKFKAEEIVEAVKSSMTEK